MHLSLKLSLIIITSMLLISCATSNRRVTLQDLAQPLTTVGSHKTPRVSIAAPPNTKVALELFRDNERICTIVGQLMAYKHRMYYSAKNNLLIADGVCYGSPIQATGARRYVLNGTITSAKGKKIVVRKSSVTSPYRLVEPLILIDEKNQVSLYLAES
jgi:hypothetical protein